MRLPWEMNRLPGQLRADLQDRLLGSLCKAGIAQIAGIVCQHMSRYVKICQQRHVLKMPCGHACQDLYKAEGLDLQASCHGYTIDFFAKGIFFVIHVLCRQGFGSSRGYRSPPRMEDLRQGVRWNGWNGISRSKIPRDPENS